MSIKILPVEIAARIAAGEVIERPASVIKELVENSIDAGSTEISIQVELGGLSWIRVTDNGCGISPDEIDLAFHRHATSKLATLEDLSSISTFGFRGEALASIAAASKVTLITRPTGSDTAFMAKIESGQISPPQQVGASLGTSILVESLFSTIPARLKFIKSYQAEGSRILNTVEHLALANSHVKFTYTADNKNKLVTSGNGQLRDVISALRGVNQANTMIEVNSHAGRYRVMGLTSAPEHYKGNRTGISIFINGRWITNRSISAAIEEAYRGLLMQGNYPISVIFLEIPSTEVDVNVHPNKREVRLVNENDGFSSVHRAIREAMLKQNPVIEAHGIAINSYTAVPEASNQPGFGFPANLDRTYASRFPERVEQIPDTIVGSSTNFPHLEMVGQIANMFLVADGGDGMYLIDQHSAHESLLYYRLLNQWELKASEIQPMLQPIVVDLTPEQMDVISSYSNSFERYGLNFEAFGNDSLLVRSIPLVGRSMDIEKFINETLQSLARNTDLTDTHANIAASLACHSAIRAGQKLNISEIRALGDALVREGNPNHCPHGRPTLLRISLQSLEKEFGRIQ